MDGYLSTQELANIDAFLEASERDAIEAKFALAAAYMYGSDELKKNSDRALQIFTDIAQKQGDDEAEYIVGMLHLNGETYLGTKPKIAVDWLLNAAEKGNVEAQFTLGLLYKDGRGVEKSEEEAIKWLRAAKNQRHAPAAHHLYVLTADPSHLRVDPLRPTFRKLEVITMEEPD